MLTPSIRFMIEQHPNVLDKELYLTNHYKTHTECIEKINNAIEHNAKTDYMFDVNSFFNWVSALQPEYENISPVSVPIRIPDYNDNAVLTKAVIDLKDVMANYHGFLRTDCLIPKKSIEDLKKGKRFAGISRNLINSDLTKFKITNEVKESQLFSVSPDLFLFVQEGFKESEFFSVNVYGGEIIREDIDSPLYHAVTEEVELIIGLLKAKNIRPYHPVMSELDIPDLTFTLVFDINKLSLINAHIYLNQNILDDAMKKLADELNREDTRND